MSVSKLFKKKIELLHEDIYNVSLGICSKKRWFKVTHPHFDFLICQLRRHCDIDLSNKFDLMCVYSEGSLFRTFLHFFYCKRSCDNEKEYCKICSHVRYRNFQNLLQYDDVILQQRDHYSEIGLENRKIDFDVFMANFDLYTLNKNGQCRRKRFIKHSADIFVCFVSTFVRVNLNNCYNFFLDQPLTLNDEKYCTLQIGIFVKKIMNEVWKLNVNYFFVIFNDFNKLNQSSCYEIKSDQKITYTPLTCPTKTYYGELAVIPQQSYHLFAHDNESSYFDSDSDSSS